MKFLRRMMAMCLCGMLLFCFCIPAAHAEETKEQITDSEVGAGDDSVGESSVDEIVPKVGVYSAEENESDEAVDSVGENSAVVFSEEVGTYIIKCEVHVSGKLELSFDVIISDGDNILDKLNDGIKNTTYDAKEWKWKYPGNLGTSIEADESYDHTKIYDNACTVGVKRDHEHVWDDGKQTKQASCKEEGELTYTCTVTGCGETRIEIIPKTDDHTWDEGKVTTEAKCGEAGVKTYTCTVCGKTKTEEIPATGNHTYENGFCTVCGAEQSADSGSSSSASSSSSSSSSSSHSSGSSSSSDDAVYSPGRLLDANGISNLSISVYSTSIPTDLAAYDQALDGGSYIGFYRVDTYVGGVLTQTLPNAIRVTVDIPAQYLAAGRNFYMLAIQDGKTVVLSDLDAIEGTITFDASQFGNTFALVYKDGTIATALTSAATIDSPRTGDDTVVLPYVLLALVSAACAGVITKKYLILGKSAKV